MRPLWVAIGICALLGLAATGTFRSRNSQRTVVVERGALPVPPPAGSAREEVVLPVATAQPATGMPAPARAFPVVTFPVSEAVPERRYRSGPSLPEPPVLRPPMLPPVYVPDPGAVPRKLTAASPPSVLRKVRNVPTPPPSAPPSVAPDQDPSDPSKVVPPADAVPAVSAVPAPPEPAAGQCGGLTRRGDRCRRKTRDSSGFCYQHRPKTEARDDR